MKYALALVLAAAIAAGCTNTKKTNNASNGPPAMNVAAVDVPPPSTAPPASFTPAQQPVITEPVATATPEEPQVEQVAMTEEIAPARPVRSAPRAKATGGSRYKVKKGDSLWSIAEAVGSPGTELEFAL